ncbi:accessory Sec system S-layer assembly protein [Anoxybacteroides amylolyticum]|uniref:Accessory Sec system S-layer assembly protein n=1 Tax=Anoxybacteroides amylolyticum TaxID=294699 RepID=A0A167T120_9BACL|nr:accessory Sec system S-layer assembly protein [Anoxybacillus amylolyticus]ANB59281.1 accessory Sec system S-layer assembly protein [Anoxybacillus amylolyticus]
MIFKRKTKTTPNTETLPDHKEEQTSEEVRTTLSFHPDWDVSPQERYVYQFHHQQLPPLKPNQLSISGIKLIEYNDGFVVVAFLRSTLPKPVRFEQINLLLLDENGQAIAKRTFAMDSFGELPPMTARPWRFLFSAEDKLVDKIPQEGWKIAFELKQTSKREDHRLDLEASWEQALSTQQREHLQKLIETLPPLSVGEINFMGLEAKLNEKRDLVVTLLIRNGSDKHIQLEQIPLVIEDAYGDVICKGVFQLEQFEVKANTSKPWTFIFPSTLLLKEDVDLTKWRVYPPKQ